MDKKAAYNLGVELALNEAGLTKEAIPLRSALLPAVLGAGGAGVGALLSPEDRLTGALIGGGVGAAGGVGLRAARKALRDAARRGMVTPRSIPTPTTSGYNYPLGELLARSGGKAGVVPPGKMREEILRSMGARVKPPIPEGGGYGFSLNDPMNPLL